MGLINSISGGGGSAITVVNNYSALPTASTVTGLFYWCSNSQGTKWLPSSLGGTYYNSGMYYSNGTTWEFLNVPYQATQPTVDAGLNNDQFLTSFTFENAIKWLTKQATLISGTNIKTINGTSVLGSGDLIVTAGATNLTTTQTSTSTTVNSDTGTDASISLGDGVNAGVTLNNYTNAEKSKLSGITGVNTGDQTSIVGITGTKAQFNTAVTDGDIQYVGDAPTAHTHTLLNVTDVTMTVANLNSLDDGNNSNLHFHDTDRARANHTGTQLASTISDIQTAITNNASVVANTAKTSNATHTGEVTGATALTIGANVVTNTKLAQMTANTFKANNTGVTANATDITPTQAKALLAITNSDVSGLGTLATQNGTFSGSSSGTNTGDETTSSIQTKRPLKTVNGNSLEGSGNIVISGGSGEVNTASNTGTVGVGVFKQKTTFDLEFYKLNPASNKVSIALSGTDRVDFNVNEANFTGIPQSAVTNLTTDLSNKQNNITLTTTGTSGQATLVGSTLNIPNYAPAGGSGLSYQEVMRLTKIR